MVRLLWLSLLCAHLGGCYTSTRLREFGTQPPMTPTQDPTARKGYRPLRMPMPDEKKETSAPNSLWRTGARAFFKDQRASKIGDIVTVLVRSTERIEFRNETTNKRDPGEISSSLGAFFGLEQKIPNPNQANPVPLLNGKSKLDHKGKNDMKRQEVFDFRVAASVMQILPNGNLVILGRQEVRMNFEIRELVVSGVVAPSEIASDNTVGLHKIAEARISYGGRGDGMDTQQTPYGHTLVNRLFPF